MTACYAKFAKEAPLTAAYNQSILEMQAFFNSYWPFIPFGDRPVWVQINARVFNVAWILDLLLDSQGVFVQPGPWPGWVNADNGIWRPFLGVTPNGVPSPVAQAMAAKALSPEWAEFFGIPLNYTANYASAALPTAKLSLSAAPASIAQGASTAMTASVTYPNGMAASGVAVNFLSDGKEVGSAVTGTNGQATLAYTPTAAGTYSLTADLASPLRHPQRRLPHRNQQGHPDANADQRQQRDALRGSSLHGDRGGGRPARADEEGQEGPAANG